MTAYYNEHDAAAAEWLRNLIGAGLLPHGDVDERDIQDVQPNDLHGYRQVHMFAGVGGWALACRLAGIDDDSSIWTGSCPCQPFSVAGRGRGTADARHLWPDFMRLIRACRPAIVVGEQVAGAAGYGWFDGVRSDMEDEAYACRAVDIPACAVNAPHIRSRLYWCAVADAEGIGRTWRDAGAIRGQGQPAWAPVQSERRDDSGMGNADTLRHLQPQGMQPDERRWTGDANHWRDAAWITCHDGKARRSKSGISLLVNGISGRVAVSRAGQTGEAALQDPEARWISRTAAWRGFGNAVAPVLAAEVLRALMETL